MQTAVSPFAPGRILVTPRAAYALSVTGQRVEEFLQRHLQRDWGDELSAEDRAVNGDGSGWCMSSYRTDDGDPLWIITEHDHSVTTVLLSEEY
jgi:hypothetical protein